MPTLRAFAYLPPAASVRQKGEKPMNAHTIAVLVIGAAMFVIALVGLMVKLIKLGQR